MAVLEGILVVRPHDLLENERTSVSDVAGSAGVETAFSLGLLAELAVTADSMYEFNIESKAVRVCQSVTTSSWLCWMPGGSSSYFLGRGTWLLTSVEHVLTGVWLLDTSPCGPPAPYPKPGFAPDLQRLAVYVDQSSL